MNPTLKALAAVAAFALATPAAAVQLFATSYDTPNGDGQASGGSFNYWDIFYTGSGMTTVDGAALSGGLGDLTDGIIAGDIWLNTESAAGTGPYVGWYGASGTKAPLITFHFDDVITLDTMRIHLDNSGVGGVFAPAAILVDGVAQAFTAPTGGTIGFVDLVDLNLAGADHTLQFIQAFDQSAWVFVSEVTFFGDAKVGGGIPEPAAWALMIAGFGLTGATLRRRRPALA